MHTFGLNAYTYRIVMSSSTLMLWQSRNSFELQIAKIHIKSVKFKNSTIILELFGLPQNCFGRRICMISSSNALIYIYMIYLEYLQIIHPSASHPPLSIAVYVRVRIFVCTFEVNGKTLDTAGHLIHSRLSGLQIRKQDNIPKT